MHSANETTNKLIMLFVFDKMEIPLVEDTVVDICSVTNEWIPQMECRILIHDLLESDLLCSIVAPNQDMLYAITAAGRECLAHFFIRIPASLRDHVSEFVSENRMMYRRKQEYLPDYFKNADG
ncbi:MAG: DUF4364 family protein, partial [Clostridia bacterium]|nr:DUF4364 family protein [Clostridia bacterium]